MKIVVVGGGTAGCIAALKMQNKFPQYDITIIESSSIGIVGVGEATTGNFIPLIKSLGIDIKEFMKETKATVKMGGLFSNWNNENKDFWVPLVTQNSFYNKNYKSLIMSCLQNNESLLSLDENAIFALQNKVPKHLNYLNGNFAIHFDTFLCGIFLKKIAKQRGIKVIDDTVTGFETTNNEITSVLLSNNNIDADFVFDCSGFNRLIIGKFYNESWISVSETLPINHSIVGPLPMTQKIPPYVKITAMDFGWSFKIPTVERYGFGYNFDKNYISEENAILEIKNKIDKSWEPSKSIVYNSGYYKNHFVENCLAIGLSGSFFEPMEASAIMTAVSIMNEFADTFEEYLLNKVSFRNKINKYIKDLEDDIVSAIYIHYVTNKTNNDFWKNFTLNNKMPKQIENFLHFMQENIPDPMLSNFTNKKMSYLNDYFVKIYYGNGLKNYHSFDGDKKTYAAYNKIISVKGQNWQNHEEMLQLIHA